MANVRKYKDAQLNMGIVREVSEVAKKYSKEQGSKGGARKMREVAVKSTVIEKYRRLVRIVANEWNNTEL